MGLSADRINYRASMQRIKHCYTLLHLPIIPGSLVHAMSVSRGSMNLMNPWVNGSGCDKCDLGILHDHAQIFFEK